MGHREGMRQLPGRGFGDCLPPNCFSFRSSSFLAAGLADRGPTPPPSPRPPCSPPNPPNPPSGRPNAARLWEVASDLAIAAADCLATVAAWSGGNGGTVPVCGAACSPAAWPAAVPAVLLLPAAVRCRKSMRAPTLWPRALALAASPASVGLISAGRGAAATGPADFDPCPT